jgi:hypothetical protein
VCASTRPGKPGSGGSVSSPTSGRRRAGTSEAEGPLNEPHPAREAGYDGPEDPGFASWMKAHRGTTADLENGLRAARTGGE